MSFVDSLLLVTARGRSSLSDSTQRDEWPELLSSAAGRNEERIDPLKRDENPVITSSALEEQLKNDANSVSVSDVTFVHRTISAATTVTGRGKRRWKKRAAEILVGTSVKHQVADVSSPSAILSPETSTLPPPPPPTAVSNTTQVPDSSSPSVETSDSEPTTISSVPLSSTTIATTTLMETTASVTGDDLLLSSSSVQPEPQDESIHSYQNVSTFTQSSTTTTTANSNADEYFADDASSSTSTTDANFDEEETTLTVTDKISIAPSLIQHPEMDSEHVHITSPTWIDEVNNHPTTSPDTSVRPLLAVSSSVIAVGRALSQEESVPWPEAKSTKVIGTIIEDIHGPFSDGVSSVSTISPDVLTGSGIAAIVMCIFLVLVTTAGESNTKKFHVIRKNYNNNNTKSLRFDGCVRWSSTAGFQFCFKMKKKL